MHVLLDHTGIRALNRALECRATGEGDVATLLDFGLGVLLAERFLCSSYERNYVREATAAAIDRLGHDVDPACRELFAPLEPTDEHMDAACNRAAADLEGWLGLIADRRARWPDIPEHANWSKPQAVVSNLELDDFLTGGYRDEAVLDDLREFGHLRLNELIPAVAVARSEAALRLLADIQEQTGWNERRTAILENFVRTQVYRYLPHIVEAAPPAGGDGSAPADCIVYWPHDFRKRGVVVPAIGLAESLVGADAAGGDDADLVPGRFDVTGLLGILLRGDRAEPAGVLGAALELREALAPVRAAMDGGTPLDRRDAVETALRDAMAAAGSIDRNGGPTAPPSELRVVGELLPPCKLSPAQVAPPGALPPALAGIAARCRAAPKAAVALQRLESDAAPPRVAASAYRALLARCMAD